VGRKKDEILTALAELKQTYALEKPILAGNGSLKSLLQSSGIIDAAHQKTVADTFLKHGAFVSGFWSDLSGLPKVEELRTTVNVGHVAKNFTPMVDFLKKKIEDPQDNTINQPSDLAKLTQDQWVAFIKENGESVPPDTDGAELPDKIQNYAATLMSRSEVLFPAVALAATVSRSDKKPLPHVEGIQALLSDHPDLDFRRTNLDVFVKKNNIPLDTDTLTEARVLQRVHRIAPTAASGQALLDQKIHNSAQIVAMGKGRFTELMTTDPSVDARAARTMFGFAQHQYAQVLQRIADYRFELHRADPRAIVRHTYTPDELQGTDQQVHGLLLPEELAEVLTAVPELETLFGSLDFCDCPHCQSVYGPPAYLADLFRYLDGHNAEEADKMVQDVLFDRRPDLGNIKLNCENTETPIPYVDLVCEILENALSAPDPNPDFDFQTTRPAEELRAFPEHVRGQAYDVLRQADYPINASFHLWQEEARVFLQHLGAPRWELMETFQSRQDDDSVAPTDASIAGEFLSISSYETEIITKTSENTATRQTAYWGFDANSLEMIVSDFMTRARLDYTQLLELLYVQWINPITDPNRMIIERPDATCDISKQKLTNLTVDRLDRMHRFLRLWRHTGWTMWELDLLIRSGSLGSGQINETTLVNLKHFKQFQQRLGLDAEQTLTLFGGVNTQVRLKIDTLDREIDPLYSRLFLNSAVIKPVDEAFRLYNDEDPHLFVDYTGPLIEGKLSLVKATLLAAFAVTEPELALLLEKVNDDTLTIANLAKIGRRVYLARGLGMRIEDLLTLETLIGVSDIFASPRDLLDFIEQIGWAAQSGFVVGELDYLLNLRPDSPFGLREETLTQSIGALREALRANSDSKPDGVIISQVADTFGLTPDQAKLLVTRVKLESKTLLDHLKDDRLTKQDAKGSYTTEITFANFPEIYNSYNLLHKLGLLVGRFKITRDDLDWLLSHAGTFKMLDLSTLPVTVAPDEPLFPAWLALYKWLYFEQSYPEPEGISLRVAFDKAASGAPEADVKTAIAKVTSWEADDLDDLTKGLRLHHNDASSDYADVETYLRLWKCFKMIKRAGVGASAMLTWAKRDDNTGGTQAATAQQIQQAVKAKYDYSIWLDKAASLEDGLREKKRDALINYLVETSLRTKPPEIQHSDKTYANPAYWRDANDLLNYYLIDVQMGACQLTSRIKQAISSVQMFVQRCLLGLEQPFVEVSRSEQQDTVSENSWKQWRWMKSYRLWEANRKVFLYPENWIEPELRDDKTPFFEELESEILQKDITDENVETAFRHYVQKVHEVACLDIVCVYYELDDTNPSDLLLPDINRLHVIGRTRAHPTSYYYRNFDLNYGEWSPWEKIDVDIQSDQVTAAVYNRQLYLFWLHIVEKPQKVKKQPPAQPSDNTNVQEPPNQLEIQLSWSSRKDKDGSWTAKRLSKQKLIHPWQRPHFSYNLMPSYKDIDNTLLLKIYISQSKEFNDTKFWNVYRNELAYYTLQRWDETARPWHSSSFVFNGEVVDVKFKGLAGVYHSIPKAYENSYDFVREGFGEAGLGINLLNYGYSEIGPRLPLPEGMHYENTRLTNNKRLLNANRANILERGQTRSLLNGAKSPFEIIFSQHRMIFDTVGFDNLPMPFLYQDSFRAFFIRPELQGFTQGYNQTIPNYTYDFFPFYHPYTALFLRELNRLGIEGLLNRGIQTTPQAYYPGNNFKFSNYNPNSMSIPDPTVLTDQVDFARYGAYSIYNWEIFFHAPLMIACRLSANQRFEEAMRWFHYIFDPTNTESPDVPQRYWITRPFFEQNSEEYRKQRIENLLANIDLHKDELIAWKNKPFKPHLIARYRPVAYQKAVVMKYIDNLIAWGDQLFRRDTVEAINEATTIYVLAYEILGRRPVKVPNVQHADKSYNELTADGALDPFGNKRVEILMENFTEAPVRVTRVDEGTEPLPQLDMFYFGIPNNDLLLNYWMTVEDRLFKIRHCMNIAGVVRQLPLFEPPIDPALLVKAVAAGIDPDSVLSDLALEPGPYRFERLAQKSLEICADVKALGEKLLGALINYDAEGLSLLRSTQEIQMQNAIREVRKQQITEANETCASLERSKQLAEQRRDYYQGREFMNSWESDALIWATVSLAAQGGIALGYILAGGLWHIPRFVVGSSGFGGTPHITADTVDGAKLAKSAEAAVSTLSAIAAEADKASARASTMGGYRRRKQDWDFQGQQAVTEIAQIEKQIAGAQIRLAIAEKELENHDLQIEHSQAVDEYMRNKYTNQQLFDWQVRQVAALYFQSYQLAYDMAKRAEKSFQFEIGDPSAIFVQFGYWDSLKKGLLAGERLANDIRRMEAAYLNRNRRDLEITKNVSLAQVSPVSLIELKERGTCQVTLPEWLFDMDYPGHIRRRIKSVSITVPCVVGPYTSLNCTLSLTQNSIRLTDDVAAPDAASYGDPLDAGEDPRFYSSPAPAFGIATSHGQNDAGMFELNFRDDRFLPFEGYGAVSEWQIEMLRENNQFDLSTISDVILHVRYTSSPTTKEILKQAAKANLAAKLPTEGRSLLVLNQHFGSAWHRFLHPGEGAEQRLAFTLGREHLPFYTQGKTVTLTGLDLIVEGPETISFDVKLTTPGTDAVDELMKPDAIFGDRQHLGKSDFAPNADLIGDWVIQIKKEATDDWKSLQPGDLRNAYFIVGFRPS
jgi:hypothetical protein